MSEFDKKDFCDAHRMLRPCPLCQFTILASQPVAPRSEPVKQQCSVCKMVLGGPEPERACVGLHVWAPLVPPSAQTETPKVTPQDSTTIESGIGTAEPDGLVRTAKGLQSSAPSDVETEKETDCDVHDCALQGYQMTSDLPSLIDTVKALDATTLAEGRRRYDAMFAVVNEPLNVYTPVQGAWLAWLFDYGFQLMEASTAAPRLALEVETMAELLKQVGNANTKEALFAAKDAVRAFMVKR